MSWLVWICLVGCVRPAREAGAADAPTPAPAVVSDAPDGCPYWYLAPCGDDFDHEFVCEPCREQVYSCGRRGDPSLDRWGESGWPCECIDPESGTVMKWKPGCKGHDD